MSINPQQLTPAQTALQRMSEKHLDFEIQAVNTIQPSDIEYTKKSQPLVSVDTPLSVIRKHIPRQFEYRNMHDTQTRITNPGTIFSQSLSNINVFLKYSSLHNGWKITIWQ